MTYDSEKYIATQAVVLASKLCRNIQKNLLEKHCLTKIDQSPVTIADYASQAVIALCLFKSFPNIPILGEEDSEILLSKPEFLSQVTQEVRKNIPNISEKQILKVIDRSSRLPHLPDLFWTLDPIDGTKVFIKRSHYAIALALVKKGSVVLGVLGCPNLTPDLIPNENGTIYIAEKGRGAHKRSVDNPAETIIQVSPERDVNKSIVCTSPISDKSKELAYLVHSLKTSKEPVFVHGQCKYALVAEGIASLYYRLSPNKSYQEKIWDHAAGSILVKEAGGITTDIKGKVLDFSIGTTLKNNCGILSTTKNLQEVLLQNIKTHEESKTLHPSLAGT
ncbi:MAG: 3'(2'), 5'-bisphosphate nucleotidase [Chlamydiales bacterium]|jgi:3'(2'), 5'-bisphosphate nucleotidase